MPTPTRHALIESGPPSQPTFPPKTEWPIFIYDPDQAWANQLAASIRTLGYTEVRTVDSFKQLPLQLGVGRAMILIANPQGFPNRAAREGVWFLRLYRHDLAVAAVADGQPGTPLSIGEDLVVNRASLLDEDCLRDALNRLEEAGQRRAWRSYQAADHNYRTRREQRSPHTRY
jgi:hypothetical protein